MAKSSGNAHIPDDLMAIGLVSIFNGHNSIPADIGHSLGDHDQPHIDVISGRVGVGTHLVCRLHQGLPFR